MDYCYFLVLALSELLRRWVGDEDQSKFGALLSGLSTKTVQENAEIWHLAQRINGSPELQQAFANGDATSILATLPTSAKGEAYLAEIQAFIAENGHRGGSERDLAFPRWRHRPELFINALRSIASADASSNPEQTEARMVSRREKTTDDVARQLKAQPLGSLKCAVFKWVLRWTLKYVHMRDEQRYYADYYMGARYDFFTAIGNRLAARGLLQDPGHVFFLGLDEIHELWEGRLSRPRATRRIEAREQQHKKYAKEAPPFYMRAGLPVEVTAEDEHATILTGVTASSGRVHGRARVCKSLEEASGIEKGDILVAAATDPGWTPVFSILGGVVIETGGALAHATLVSREYGIPCVTYVARATERIRDGEMITVDGNAGKVILDRDEVPAGE
jgi:pyruvate,water dikinase